MPIHLEISRLQRTVVIVARGAVTPEDIRQTMQELVDKNVRPFGKIIDIFNATSDIDLAQIRHIAGMLRGRPEETRGPVAFVINPERGEFADAFAMATEGERPLKLFRSIHDARRWVEALVLP